MVAEGLSPQAERPEDPVNRFLLLSPLTFDSSVAGLFWTLLARRVAVRFLLALAALVVGGAAIGTTVSASLPTALASASAMGFGVGGLHLLVRLAWADYYGREHLGSIRGLTLSAQIGGQAVGPILAGFLFDTTGSYQTPFLVFASAVWAGGLLVLAAVPPKLPASDLQSHE